MRIWGLLFVLLVALMVPSVSAAQFCGGYEVPETGDWLVNESVVCVDENLVLNGNLLINASGTLIVENTILQFNSTSDGEFGIENNGSLVLQLGSVVESNSSNSYTFISNAFATLEIKDSSVHDCGHYEYMNYRVQGIYTESEGSNITDSEISGNYRGVIVQSDDANISGNDVKLNTFGLKINGSNIIIGGNTIYENTNSPLSFVGVNILFDSNVVDNGSGSMRLAVNNSVISNNNFYNNTERLQILGNGNNITGNVMLSDDNMIGGLDLITTSDSLVSGNVIEGNEYGLYLYYTTDTVVKDCSFNGSSIYDILMISAHSTTFENVVYDTLMEMWSFDLTVNDIAGYPIEDANVDIIDNMSTLVYSDSTNPDGGVSLIMLGERIENSSGTFVFYPYTIDVTKDGYVGNSTEFNATSDVSIILTMNGTDETEPENITNATFIFTVSSPQENMTYMNGDLYANDTLKIEAFSDTNITSCSYSVGNLSGSISKINDTLFREYFTVTSLEGDYLMTIQCESFENVTNSTSVAFSIYPDYECSDSDDCYSDEICSSNMCIELECDCGYGENHECVDYECCLDSECLDEEFCDLNTNTCEVVYCDCPEKRYSHQCNMLPGYCCSDFQCGNEQVCDIDLNECIDRRLNFVLPDNLYVGQKVRIVVLDQDGNSVEQVGIVVKYPDTDPLVDEETYYTDANGVVEIPIVHAGRIEINARKGGYYLDSETGDVPEPFNILLIVEIIVLIGCIAGGVVVYFKFIKGQGLSLGGLSFGGGGPLKLEKTVSGTHVMLRIKNKTENMIEGATIRDSVPKGSFMRSRMTPSLKELNATTDILTWELLRLGPGEEVVIQYDTKAANKGFSVMVNGKEQKA